MRTMGTRRRPTIQELQDILDDPNCGPIEILGDGSATVDAELTRLRDELHRSEQERAIIGGYNLWLRRRIWAGVSMAFAAGAGAMWLLLQWVG